MEEKYLRMIRNMKDQGPSDWVVYILRCGDGTLYTGVTNALPARLKKHMKGTGAAYTRTHPPVSLVYREENLSRSQALIREAALKRLSRARKERMLSVSGIVSVTIASVLESVTAPLRKKLKKGEMSL